MKRLVLFILLISVPLSAKSIVGDWTFNGSATILPDSTGRAPTGIMYSGGSPATSWVTTPQGKAFDCHGVDANGGVIDPSTYTNYTSTITIVIWWANTESVINNANGENENLMYKAYTDWGGDSNSSFLPTVYDDEGYSHFGEHNLGRAISWWFQANKGTNAQCSPFSNGFAGSINGYIDGANPLCIIPRSPLPVCAIMGCDSDGSHFWVISDTDNQKAFISTADMWTYWGYGSPTIPFNIAYNNGAMNLLCGEWGHGSLGGATIDPIYRVAILDYIPTDEEALALAKGSTPPPASSGVSLQNISVNNVRFQ